MGTTKKNSKTQVVVNKQKDIVNGTEPTFLLLGLHQTLCDQLRGNSICFVNLVISNIVTQSPRGKSLWCGGMDNVELAFSKEIGVRRSYY